jgi:hypothetical protein
MLDVWMTDIKSGVSSTEADPAQTGRFTTAPPGRKTELVPDEAGSGVTGTLPRCVLPDCVVPDCVPSESVLPDCVVESNRTATTLCGTGSGLAAEADRTGREV